MKLKPKYPACRTTTRFNKLRHWLHNKPNPTVPPRFPGTLTYLSSPYNSTSHPRVQGEKTPRHVFLVMDDKVQPVGDLPYVGQVVPRHEGYQTLIPMCRVFDIETDAYKHRDAFRDTQSNCVGGKL